MALTGTLKDFGIAEILQLIGTQKKTGVLTLEDQQHRAEIDFSDGMVVGARGGTAGLTLEDRLVRSELITDSQRIEAERKVKETLKPLTAVLISENMVEPRTLRETIALHISEIVFETFAWKSGTYAFEQNFIQWDKQLVSPMSAESIMMDGLRIFDETPTVMKAIASLDDKYVPSLKAGPSRTLSIEAQNVFNLLDGQRTVKDVILRARIPRFEVLKHLAKMLTSGLIAPVANGPAIISVTAPPTQSGKINRMTQISVWGLLVVIGFVALAHLGLIVAHTANPVVLSGEIGGTTDPIEKVQLERVRNALEAYRDLRGSYPESWDELIKIGLIRGCDLKYLQRNQYSYSKTEQGYRLGREAMPHQGAEVERPAGKIEETRR